MEAKLHAVQAQYYIEVSGELNALTGLCAGFVGQKANLISDLSNSWCSKIKILLLSGIEPDGFINSYSGSCK
jgi:hypothetical protein